MLSATRLWRGCATLLLACALLLGPSGCDRTHVESMQELANGMRWYRDGVHNKARERFRAAVEIEPSNHIAQFYLGMVLLHQLKEAPAAVVHLRKAYELQPAYAEYGYQLATALMTAGGHEREAEEILQKTLQTDPEHAEAAYRLGLLALLREDADSAVGMLTRAIEKRPRFALPYVELANLYSSYEHFDEALQVIENAARNCAPNAEVFHEQGRLLAAKGRFGDAIASYEKALALRPDHEGALFNLGVAHLERQEKRQALQYFRRYIGRVGRGEDPARRDAAELTIAQLEQELGSQP